MIISLLSAKIADQYVNAEKEDPNRQNRVRASLMLVEELAY